MTLRRAWVAVSILALAGCSHLRPPTSLPDRDGRAGLEEHGVAESSWFMNQRAGADPLPVRARSAALESWRARGFTTAPGSWLSIGPYNVGGRVTALAADPHDPDRVWVGTADGGVFVPADPESESTFVSWRPVFDAQVALSIGSIASHPTYPNTAYVGTGEDNGGGYSYDGEGVFKTTDGGATWTSVGLAETRRIGRIAIDPLDPERVFVAAGGGVYHEDSDRGIYRSEDGGKTWQQVLFVATDTGGIDLAIDPSNPSRVFAALWQRHAEGDHWHLEGPNSGVYRSVDGGTSWTKLGAGLPTIAGRIGLALAPSNPAIVYALISGESTFQGLYRSNDSGDTWTKVNNSSLDSFLAVGRGYYFTNILVDPSNAAVVYVLDLLLLRSTNGGVSFSSVTYAVHPDFHAMLVGPGSRLRAGCDGGLYQSPDGGTSWEFLSGLPISQVYDIAVDHLQPSKVCAALQDNASWMTATSAPFSWVVAYPPGDGLECEIDPTDSNRMYAEYQYGGMARSLDGGATWSSATSGFGGRTNWKVPITLDPITPLTLYTGSENVYRSVNGAASWGALGPDLTVPPPGAQEDHTQSFVRRTITEVRVSPVDNHVLWAGTDNGNVWVSTNGGNNFTRVNPPGPAYWVTDIEPDPFDVRAAYLAVTGYRTGDTQPYLRVTRDFGATWTDLSGGLPQVPVNSVLPSHEWRGRIFAGTDLGVYLSDDYGATWSDVRGGLPHVVVLDLVEDVAAQKVWAGTHGRGVFRYDLTQLYPPDPDGDGVDNNLDCAPLDATVSALPTEVDLGVERALGNGTSLSWPALGAATYDVAAGSVASLRTSGTSGSAGLACGTDQTTFSDPAVPGPSQGVYYLVRGRNVCGPGSWGRNRQGAERLSPACP